MCFLCVVFVCVFVLSCCGLYDYVLSVCVLCCVVHLCVHVSFTLVVCVLVLYRSIVHISGCILCRVFHMILCCMNCLFSSIRYVFVFLRVVYPCVRACVWRVVCENYETFPNFFLQFSSKRKICASVYQTEHMVF